MHEMDQIACMIIKFFGVTPSDSLTGESNHSPKLPPQILVYDGDDYAFSFFIVGLWTIGLTRLKLDWGETEWN